MYSIKCTDLSISGDFSMSGLTLSGLGLLGISATLRIQDNGHMSNTPWVCLEFLAISRKLQFGFKLASAVFRKVLMVIW